MSRSKCGEFQDGNFKPLITKIHDRYLDHLFCAAVVAVVASTVLCIYLFFIFFPIPPKPLLRAKPNKCTIKIMGELRK